MTTPYYDQHGATLYVGDVIAVLETLPDGCVQTCVTSPPYWALRSYLPDDHADKSLEIGSEPTPDAFVAKMVEVFREVRRILRDDGCIFVNLGDSMVDKQLQGIPWRVALALQADGWYLRSDIIWSKPNPMPESCTDRPTKAHEYVFLLSKRPKYYFDSDAVREAPVTPGLIQGSPGGSQKTRTDRDGASNDKDRSGVYCGVGGRNIRTVWSIATQPYPEAHFATYPEKLVTPCVKAGTSERGACPACGAGWVRVVERPVPPKEVRTQTRGGSVDPKDGTGFNHDGEKYGSGQKLQNWLNEHPAKTTGWSPGCECDAGELDPGPTVRRIQRVQREDAGEPVPCVVLDPFAGSFTTGAVAVKLGRRAIGIELSETYAALAVRRIEAAVDSVGLFAQGANDNE